MEVMKSSVEEMASYPETIELVEALKASEDTIEDWFHFLRSTCSVWKVLSGDEVMGFYTLTVDGFFGEGHAYVFKQYRHKSKRIIKHMIWHVKNLGLIPKTTATSDFPHVVKFLKMLGFTEMGVEVDGIIKDSGPVDVTYFIYFN